MPDLDILIISYPLFGLIIFIPINIITVIYPFFYVKDKENGTFFDYIYSISLYNMTYYKTMNRFIMDYYYIGYIGFDDYDEDKSFYQFYIKKFFYKIYDIYCVHKTKNNKTETYPYIEQCSRYKDDEILIFQKNISQYNNISFNLWKNKIIVIRKDRYYLYQGYNSKEGKCNEELGFNLVDFLKI